MISITRLTKYVESKKKLNKKSLDKIIPNASVGDTIINYIKTKNNTRTCCFIKNLEDWTYVPIMEDIC